MLHESVCMRWVPKQWTDRNKQVWIDIAWKFQAWHASDLIVILCIISGDELWILYITLIQKEDSQVWDTKSEPMPKNFVLTIQQENSLLSILGSWGVLSVNFQEGGIEARMNS